MWSQCHCTTLLTRPLVRGCGGALHGAAASCMHCRDTVAPDGGTGITDFLRHLIQMQQHSIHLRKSEVRVSTRQEWVQCASQWRTTHPPEAPVTNAL